MVELLAHRGTLSASQISEEFDVTPQAMSQHLRVLREANVIRMERRAQQRLYSFNPGSTTEMQGWAAEMANQWNRRLDRIGQSLNQGSS